MRATLELDFGASYPGVRFWCELPWSQILVCELPWSPTLVWATLESDFGATYPGVKFGCDLPWSQILVWATLESDFGVSYPGVRLGWKFLVGVKFGCDLPWSPILVRPTLELDFGASYPGVQLWCELPWSEIWVRPTLESNFGATYPGVQFWYDLPWSLKHFCRYFHQTCTLSTHQIVKYGLQECSFYSMGRCTWSCACIPRWYFFGLLLPFLFCISMCFCTPLLHFTSRHTNSSTFHSFRQKNIFP